MNRCNTSTSKADPKYRNYDVQLHFTKKIIYKLKNQRRLLYYYSLFENKNELIVILYFSILTNRFQGLQQLHALTFRLLLHVSRMFSILPMFSSVTNISVRTDICWSEPLDHDLSGSVRNSSFDKTDTLLDVWGASAEKQRNIDEKWEKLHLEALDRFKFTNTFRQSTTSGKTCGVNILLEWFLYFASVPITKRRQSNNNRARLTSKSEFG